MDINTAREQSKIDNKEYTGAILWEEVISPLIKDYSKNELSKFPFVKIKNSKKTRKKFIKLYCHYENLLLEEYMINSKRIDRHKIVAVCIKVLKRIKIFYVSFLDKIIFVCKNQKIPDNLLLINENFSLEVAYKILDSYIRTNSKQKGLFYHPVEKPEPFYKKDSMGNFSSNGNSDKYLKNYAAELHFSTNSKVNLLTHANVFFLLEKYSCRKAQCDNLEEECRRLLLHYGECTSDNVNAKIDEIRFRIKNDTNTDISN